MKTHLKHDPDIRWDGETLAIRKCKQLVVVQYRVEVLHPLRVYITVKDDPLPLVDLSTHIVNDLPIGGRREVKGDKDEMGRYSYWC